MKIKAIALHNFRSVIDASFDPQDYTLLVGENNSGKSNVISALRVFYDHLKYSGDDWPRIKTHDNESWIEIVYSLSESECDDLPEKYQTATRQLRVRKVLRSSEKDRVKANQSNLYAVMPDGLIESTLFFGAKNISQAKLGNVIYIPALSNPSDHLKMSGPSALRDILSFVLKKAVSSSGGYKKLESAFASFNSEARGEAGFLTALTTPFNTAISAWGIAMQLDVKPLSPEDIIKSLVHHSFNDPVLGEETLPLERFGHGFQRSVIYELIRLAPLFQDAAEPKKKEFDPDFTLLLFEEPEAFLHPDQQITMSLNLRRLGALAGQQVLITTHSPIFAGKSANDLKQIVRIAKADGISSIFQVDQAKLESIFNDGRRLGQALQAFVDDPVVADQKKRDARRMLAAMPNEEIAAQEDRFRYQLWLDSDRAGVFFASKVVICEGPSERALLNYLLENQWFDLRTERISVLDALGKFNIHRYMALFNAFGIKHVIIIDGDCGREHHAAVNNMIAEMCGPHALAKPLVFDVDVETFLKLAKPPADRSDRKPIEILKAISEGRIDNERLDGLKSLFRTLCGKPAA